jgi:hypothetical protein
MSELGGFVSRKSRSATAQECYRRAMEARRMALTAVNPNEKKDLLEVEQGWLSLARSSLARSHEPEDESEDHS